jgi:general secretion pathway protein M
MSAVAALRERATTWFDGLSDREQRIVSIGAVVALALLILAIVLPLGSAVDAAKRRVAAKQGDLAWMQQVGPALGAATSAPPTSQESLIVLVDRTARESGLGQALTGSQPSGPGALRTTFEGATFDATKDPGAVNAVVVLQLR